MTLPELRSDWGPRFNGDRCKRHDEASCPSCLAYTVRELLVEVEIWKVDFDMQRRAAAAIARSVGALPPDPARAELRVVRRAERERCAKEVERVEPHCDGCAAYAAAAIRALEDET